MQKIIHNRIRCRICGDIVESVNVHDLVQCSCGACFTDGGHQYIRRGWDPVYGENPADVYEELDETQGEMDPRDYD